MIALDQRTVVHVLRRGAADHPDRVAVVDDRRSLTYGELLDASRRVAGGLGALGVGPRSTVALLLDNTVEHVLGWFGCSVLGAVEVPLNTALRPEQIAYILEHSEAEVLVADERYCDQVVALAPRLAGVRAVVLCGATPEQRDRVGRAVPAPVLPFEEVEGHAPAAVAPLRPSDVSGVLYTSGTTGDPKGVVVTHAQTYGRMWPGGPGSPTAEDRTLVVLPIYHVIGQCRGLYNTLIVGGTVVLARRFSASGFLDACRRHRITFAPLVGVMVSYLLDQEPRPDDRDHSLRHVALGTTSPRLEEFRTRFGIEQVTMSYGLTEAGGVLVGPAEPAGCGFARPDFAYRLVDEDDVEVPDGAPGELVLRPTEPWTTMAGYLKRPQATVERWRNLWLHTGDIMTRRADGMYLFVGRRAERIRVRGENVAPAEVEEHLLAHPAVADGAVVGVAADAEAGIGDQEILAAVVPRPGADVDFAALRTFLADRLPAYAVPRFFAAVAALPRTAATERVQRTALAATPRAELWDGGPSRTGRGAAAAPPGVPTGPRPT